MHKYFIIFPHAGAIRSSYAYIEKSLREDVEVIYVEYDLCATNIGSFEEFLDSIWRFLKKRITKINADIYVFAHSMGNYIVQAIENVMVSQYYVQEIIYSDGEIINSVVGLNLKTKSQHDVIQMIDNEYDIPDEIKENSILAEHFRKKLISDLSIIDLIPDYSRKLKQFKLSSEVSHRVVLSDYMDKKATISEWLEICANPTFIYLNGGHYAVLEKRNGKNVFPLAICK